VNNAKQKWNDAHYTQVKVSVPHELAAAFKVKCLADGVSMAAEISRFMCDMTGKAGTGSTAKQATALYATRPLRRKAMRRLIEQVSDILDAEQQYMDNIPDNLQGSRFYEAAEQAVSCLEEAVNSLSEAY
jgi:hypothetical protein